MCPDPHRRPPPRAVRRTLLTSLALAAVTLPISAGPPAVGEETASASELHLTTNAITTPVGDPVVAEQMVNDGTAPVDVSLLDNGVAGAVVTSGQNAAGRFLRLPVEDTASGAQATLRVAPTPGADGEDALLPGMSSFSFGADMRYEGDLRSPQGKGNNLLQRGNWGHSQYKLQVDEGRLTCRIAGGPGQVIVPNPRTRTPLVVEPGVWYRVRCNVERRVDDRDRVDVTVTMAPLVDLGQVQTKLASSVRMGAVSPTGFPIDVGGRTPQTHRDNDQFEGSLTNVVVHID